MKKAVFFDIDGTLWNEKMQIPQSTVAAVAALRAAGHYAFICSGRSRSNIKDGELLSIGFDGVLAACGTHIDFQDESVFERLLEHSEVEYALNVMKRHGVSVILEGPAYIYLNEEEFGEDPFVAYLQRELGEKVKRITTEGVFRANKMSGTLNGANLKQVGAELGELFDIIAHENEIIEIVPKGYSKATGIEYVCNLLGIERENTYAFGDSANDLEMLDFVAHGIAMGNATVEAKRAAEYVTTDIMEDGIWNGLKHYGLI